MIKVPRGKGCLGYPTPYNWGLTVVEMEQYGVDPDESGQ